MKNFMYGLNHNTFDIDYLYGVLFHDIGKLTTRYFDSDRIAHYYNHENVGAYIFILCVIYNPNKYILTDIYKDDVLLRNAFIVNYHMRPFNWNTDKAKQKALDTFTWGKCALLDRVNQADIKST
jgi:CRISPR/Cas system-associated endonuclease Cas3-HD